MIKILVIKSDNLKKAAEMISKGKLVVIPTETVYGLAANALDGKAVSNIFKAKGRPQDNPLIVHISEISDINKLVSDFPEKARLLADKFWPGPLTIILPKSEIIPDEVSAGLATVAIRMPSHSLAREIIKLSGVPLAAPSANRSGSPSPTCVKHVIEDMDGIVEAVIDGGDCEVGVESTVITLAQDKPRLLRPGYITAEQITEVIGDIEIDSAICDKLKDGEKPISPGMKYKHYAPKANVVIVKGNKDKYADFVNSKTGSKVYALCYDEDIALINGNALSYGSENNFKEQARKLFSSLRHLDELGAKIVYARAPKSEGVGLAVYNRIIRAAGFNIIEV